MGLRFIGVGLWGWGLWDLGLWFMGIGVYGVDVGKWHCFLRGLCIFTGQRVWFRLSFRMSVSLTVCVFVCLSVVFSVHVGGLKDPSVARDSAGIGFQFRTHEGIRAWQSEGRMDGIDGGEG